MTISTTTNPSIDQVKLQTFENNYYKLSQQMTSYLMGKGVIKFVASKGKTHNMGRLGRLELKEVSGRNPDWQVEDYATDNRQFTKRRFTLTILLDELKDINELIADPTSPLLNQLKYAQERVLDRVATSSALGNVTIGDSEGNTTSTTSLADGVLVVDATAGITYAKWLELRQNFTNSEVDVSKICVGVTGKEHTQLMQINEFIDNDYVDARPVQSGVMEMANGVSIVQFAGSSTGGGTVPNPVIPEASTTRDCPVMTPECIVMASEIAKLNVIENVQGKVNTTALTIDYWVGAMRSEGVKVQKLRTTI